MAIVAMTITASFPLAQTVSDAELRFREAQHKQQVERDLTGAIKLYESIAASKTADRAVKAKALLQLASCYELQGRQAEKVYDQIVRDYRDQPAVVAQARAKLAALHPPTSAPKITKIEFGNGVRHVVATDGKRAVYWNDDRTTLYSGDVAGNTRNVVFTALTDQRPVRAVASPDLSMVYIAIALRKGILKNTDGTGDREMDVYGWFFDRWPTGPGRAELTFAWSGNGRYLLANVQGDMQTHLAKISVDDGRVTVLPPLSRLFGAAVSSPDDRFIALPGESGLYIMSAQGGEPRRLIADALAPVAAWTADGKHILLRPRQSNSLFALPMKDGQVAGERIAFADAGGYRPVASAGAFMVLHRPSESLPPSRQTIYLASLDEGGRLNEWKTQDVVGTMGAYPTWSPDSREFAYVAFRGAGLENPVRIHTVAGGQDRVLFAGVRQAVMNGTIGNCLWASSQLMIYCAAFVAPSTAPGPEITGVVPSRAFRTRVISIRTDTGRMEEVGVLDGIRFLERLGPDDRTLISSLKFAPRPQLQSRRWEIGASQETETAFAEIVESNVAQSPDGRWVYRVITESENRRAYQIRSTSGGDADWKGLMRLNLQVQGPFVPVPVRYTPDSQWILYHDKDASGKDGLFRVSTSGGEPQRLGDYPTSALSSLMSISPDGRKILVHVAASPLNPVMTGPELEFGLLENFNPKAAAAPRPAAKVKK
jgi:Tol biopolymer transport system component